MRRSYSRDADGMVRTEDLCTLPEAVEGRDDGTGEQLVQDWLNNLRQLGLGQCSLVAQVRQFPRPASKELAMLYYNR